MTYKTVKSTEVFEYTEKHSKFICTVFPVNSAEKVREILKEVRTKYWDAKHNVYAYALNNGEQKFSDDGEPHGTAGKPILEVINSRGLTDVLVVVTRYFGGILLGTGGLVRAYTKSAVGAIEKCTVQDIAECVKCNVSCDYSDYSGIEKVIDNIGGEVTDTVFAEKVKIQFVIRISDKEKYEKTVSELFFGNIRTEFGEVIYKNI